MGENSLGNPAQQPDARRQDDRRLAEIAVRPLGASSTRALPAACHERQVGRFGKPASPGRDLR